MEPRTRVFVGRTSELSEIDAAIAQAARGEGTFCLLAGEAGIGKTRLAEETVRRSGFRALWGRCWEAGGAPAYWPWIQVLRELLRGMPSVTLASKAREGLARILPELRDASDASASVELDTARFALFESVTEVLRDASSDEPLAIVVDDLHFADPSSLTLLHFFVRDLRGARILVLATCRDQETRLSPALREPFAKLAREGTFLPMRRFGEKEVRDLLVERLGSDERALEILRVTEGHPLFVEEMIRAMASGLLDGKSKTLPVPLGVRDAIRTRIERLDPTSRTTLEVVAVFGREVEMQPLVAVCSATVETVEAHVRAALAVGVLVEVGPPRFALSHALVRDALYESIDERRRAELHAAVAEVLEEQGAIEVASAEIASHLLAGVAAVGHERAWDASVRAARRALSALAFEDAATIMARTVDALGKLVDPRRRAEGLLVLGEARIRSGDRESGRAACMEVAALAREAKDAELLARAALAYGAEIVVAMIDPALIALLEEALAALPEEPSAHRVLVLARLAGALQPAADPSGPASLARKAIAEARTLGDAHVLRLVLGSAGSALVEYANPAERLEIDREMYELATKAGDRDHAVRALGRIVLDRLELGEVEAVREAVSTFAKLADEIGRPKLVWRSTLHRCALATLAGDFREAVRIAADARAAARGSADPELRLFDAHVRCAIALARFADEHEIQHAVDEAMIAFANVPAYEPVAQIVRAISLARRGRLDEARSILSSVDDASSTCTAEPMAIFFVAECAALVGETKRARIYLERIAPYSNRFATWGAFGPATDAGFETVEAMLATCVGDLSRARRCFASSIARATRCGARPALARARIEAGLALGDAGLLAEGIALAEELGMALLVARGKGVAVTTTRPVAPRSFTLRREGEVWKLVSDAGTFHLKDTKGMQMLAHLLANPGREMHVLSLVASGDPGDLGDAGDVIDTDAVRAYRARLADLREEEREAEERNDRGRLEKIREERAFLERELSAGFGLGGRRRKAAAVAERARVNVQRRVKDAVKRIEEHDPALGQYLSWTVRTGTFCAYEPPRT